VVIDLLLGVLVRRLLSVFLLLGGLFVVARGALADITNVTGSTMTASNGYPFNSSNYAAIVFQTGTSSTVIDSVSVALTGLPSAGSGTFTMELWNASSGVPTSVVASVSSLTGNYGNFPSSTVNTYSAGSLGAIATTTLPPNRQYAIVLMSASTSNIYFADLLSNLYTVTDGWSYVNSLSKSGSSNWSSTINLYYIAAITTQAPAPAPAPTAAAVPTLSECTQLLLALMVLTMIGWHFHRERSY